jgi:hypothetical protein
MLRSILLTLNPKNFFVLCVDLHLNIIFYFMNLEENSAGTFHSIWCVKFLLFASFA